MKCLIVEDDPDFSDLLRLHLRLDDARLVVSMRELLRELAEGVSPDVILLDLKLIDSAVEESLALIQRIKAMAPRAHLIVVTGDERENTRDLALLRGADRFVDKNVQGFFRLMGDICSSIGLRQPCDGQGAIEQIERRVVALTGMSLAPRLAVPLTLLL